MSWKWKMLLPEIRVVNLLKYTMVGRFYSVILPGQLAGCGISATGVLRFNKNHPKSR
jgi:hypothetical protein